MTQRFVFTCLAFLLASLGGTVIGASTTNVIRLGGLPQSDCGVPFIYEGSVMVYTNSALGQGAEGYCHYVVFPTVLALLPGNLQVDLGPFKEGLERVEVDYSDGCGKGCTRLILALNSAIVAKATNGAGSGEGTLALEVVPGSVDTLYLSSFEGSFYQLRLVNRATPVPPLLQVKWNGSELVLTWPVSRAGCQLQTASSINAPTPWHPVPEPPVVTAYGYEVRLIPVTLASFFQLECP